MLRFFVLSLLAVHLVLVEGRRGHRKEVTVHTHKTPLDSKLREEPVRTPVRTPILRKEATTASRQVSNRHKRALPEPPTAKIRDTRPCVLHSFRYGCICRYGDFKCSPYPPEYPLL